MVPRYIVAGFTVDQNERAVKTIFGRAGAPADDHAATIPSPQYLRADERDALHLPAGARDPARAGHTSSGRGRRIHKVSIATQTVNMAFDPEDPQRQPGRHDAGGGHQGSAQHRPDRPDPLPRLASATSTPTCSASRTRSCT